MRENILILILSSILLVTCNNSKQEIQSQNNFQKNSTKDGLGKKSSFKKSLQWTAYKTNKKVAVTGTFNKIKLANTNESANSLEEALNGANFSCMGTSVSTMDATRDGTLSAFFFKRLKTDEIKGSFGKFENDKVPITISFDGITITKEFSYKSTENRIVLIGSVDVLSDLKAEKAFNSLHKACFDLHEGKTWTEVDLEIKISR